MTYLLSACARFLSVENWRAVHVVITDSGPRDRLIGTYRWRWLATLHVECWHRSWPARARHVVEFKPHARVLVRAWNAGRVTA